MGEDYPKTLLELEHKPCPDFHSIRLQGRIGSSSTSESEELRWLRPMRRTRLQTKIPSGNGRTGHRVVLIPEGARLPGPPHQLDALRMTVSSGEPSTQAGGNLRNEYEDLEHLHDHIKEFIERYYNQKRLHSAPGYRTPDEFESQTRGKSEADLHSATLRFFTADPQKVTTALVGEGTQTPSLPHTPTRLGESMR